jgi:hypothetical protein
MCFDPTTAMSIGGAALGAAGSILGGGQNAAAERTRAEFAQINAQMALTEASGKLGQIDRRVDQSIGAIKANFGGGNIDANSGSPLLMQAFSASQGNTDKQLTIAQGLNQAAGQHEIAGEALQRASDAETAGWLGAGTALLRGFGSIRGLEDFSIGLGGGGQMPLGGYY